MAVSTYSPPNTKIIHTTGVDLTSRPSIFKPVHLVQYDNKLPIIAVALYNNGQEYTLPTTADANIRLGKPGRKYVYNKTLGCSTDRKVLYFEVTQQMVTDFGTLNPVVEIIVSGEVAASSAITFLVEKNPVQEGDIESSSEGKAIVEYAEAAEAAAQEAKESETAAKNSKSAAEAAAKKAETAKSDTETLKSDVQGIKDAAVSETTKIKEDTQAIKNAADAAKTEATKKATEAATSADIAKQYSGNPAIVGSNNNWWIWNATKGAYEDSGKRSILAFDITYESVSAMEADVANQKTNTVAIISSDVNTEDNAKLYIKNADGHWYYLADLSGFTGNGISKWEKTSGNGAPGTTDTYTVTFTDGRDFTYTVYNGKDNANDAIITIQKNGETVGSFTTDQADDADINVEIVKDDVVNALGYVPAGGQGVNLYRPTMLDAYGLYNSPWVYDPRSNTLKTTHNNTRDGGVITLGMIANIESAIYTVSGFITVNGDIPKENYFVGSKLSTYGGDKMSKMTYDPETGQFICTQNYNDYTNENNTNWIIHVPTTKLTSETNEVVIRDFKFEKGIVTDPVWTPAPEDVLLKGEVDGRNLVLNSNRVINTTDYLMRTYSLSEPMKVEQTYTVTIYGQLGEGKKKFELFTDYPDRTLIGLAETTKGVYTGHFTVHDYHIKVESDLGYIRVYANPKTVTGITSIINKIKIEPGINPNPKWTPAPEDMVVQSKLSASLNLIFPKNAGAHNSVFRGNNLGTSVTEAQYAAIEAGTFDDIFVGDYWTINEKVYRVAGLDIFLHVGDTELKTHHAVIVPDKNMYSYVMNDDNIVTGAYYNSKMKKEGLTDALTTVKTNFGEGHIISHRALFANAVSGDNPSGWAWQSTEIDLMTERQVYGSPAWGQAAHNGHDANMQYSRFPLFSLAPEYITNRVWYWLQDVRSASLFCFAHGNGSAGSTDASSSGGVRPYFLIGVA